MKKKVIIISVIVLLLVSVLFIPFKKNLYDDGGTCTYSAMMYKIVKWKTYNAEYDESGNMKVSKYEKTSVFWFPSNTKSLDELWEIEIAE